MPDNALERLIDAIAEEIPARGGESHLAEAVTAARDERALLVRAAERYAELTDEFRIPHDELVVAELRKAGMLGTPVVHRDDNEDCPLIMYGPPAVCGCHPR